MAGLPSEFSCFTVDSVERSGDSLVLRYQGRLFGGVLVSLLAADIVEAVQPGTEIFVRYHTAETGRPGQIAHMLIRHPSGHGWAELYADWE